MLPLAGAQLLDLALGHLEVLVGVGVGDIDELLNRVTANGHAIEMLVTVPVLDASEWEQVGLERDHGGDSRVDHHTGPDEQRRLLGRSMNGRAGLDGGETTDFDAEHGSPECRR